jgi:hypothetical protein
MASDVHAIAVMPDRAGDSADALRGFKNDGERRCNSRAAVSPAGPAPIMTAVFMRWSSASEVRMGREKRGQPFEMQREERLY